MSKTKNFIAMPTTMGDRPAELFARFTYDFEGGGSVSVVVTQLPGFQVVVTEETTRRRMADIENYRLAAALGDYKIAAGLVLDALERKHGGAKILAAIDRAPKYQEPEL